MQSTVAGTRIEPWSTPEGLNDCHVQPYESYWEWDSNSLIYNAMIHPLHKFTIKGILWYQGKYQIKLFEGMAGLKTLHSRVHDIWG